MKIAQTITAQPPFALPNGDLPLPIGAPAHLSTPAILVAPPPQTTGDRDTAMLNSMADLTLRRCVSGDESMLSLLGGATFLEAFADVLDGADILAHWHKNHSVEAYTRYLSPPENRIYVAELPPGNAPVGYIVCTAPDFPIPTTPEDYELRRIYLLHRFQGMGIGRALMDQAIACAQEQGYRRLLLGVYGENFGAIRFYQKAGFTQIGERFFTVGATTHHDAVMARPLV